MNKILNKDSFQYIKEIKSESVDLILTDPPYEIADLTVFFQECKRILKPTGSIYVFGDKKMIAEKWYSQFQFPYKDLLFWYYKNSPKPKGRWRMSCQPIIYGYLSENLTWNEDEARVPYLPSTKKLNGRLRPSSGRMSKPMPYDTSKGALPRCVIECPALLGHLAKERVGHRDQKPLQLIKKLMSTSSNPGDLVVDFFGGSGTTAIAAIELNRSYLVLELDKGNYNMISERVNQVVDFVKY